MSRVAGILSIHRNHTGPVAAYTMQALFSSILQRESLTSLFQPIVDLNGGGIVGYEGLIRGPEGSPLHSPVVLFELARQDGRIEELESVCHRKHIQHFKDLNLPGRLFLNVSPQVISGLEPDDATASAATH